MNRKYNCSRLFWRPELKTIEIINCRVFDVNICQKCHQISISLIKCLVKLFVLIKYSNISFPAFICLIIPVLGSSLNPISCFANKIKHPWEWFYEKSSWTFKSTYYCAFDSVSLCLLNWDINYTKYCSLNRNT